MKNYLIYDWIMNEYLKFIVLKKIRKWINQMKNELVNNWRMNECMHEIKGKMYNYFEWYHTVKV